MKMSSSLTPTRMLNLRDAVKTTPLPYHETTTISNQIERISLNDRNLLL
jgi:hypothetical protein